MKNLLHSIIMLVMVFSVSVFATTTAVPKSDTPAVISKATMPTAGTIMLDMTQVHSQTPETVRHVSKSEQTDNPAQTIGKLTAAPVTLTGYG